MWQTPFSNQQPWREDRRYTAIIQERHAGSDEKGRENSEERLGCREGLPEKLGDPALRLRAHCRRSPRQRTKPGLKPEIKVG